MELREIFQNISETKRLPIVFIGSGISKRYTTNDYNWEELLKKCISEYDDPVSKYKEYEEIVKKEYGSDLHDHELYQMVGTQIERDFNINYWQKNIELSSTIDKDISPLKQYITELLGEYKIKKEMGEELSIFKELREKMITVITTNFDKFLEETIFTNHKKIIGQEIFTDTELGALLKIHGCVDSPDSMILTDEDYKRFEDKSKILYAKIISLFADNPVIFMGYGINDENIRRLLHDIFTCLDKKESKAFEERLIFVEFDKEIEKPLIGSHSIVLKDNNEISMTKIRLSDFSPLYNEMLKLRNITELKEIQRLRSLVYEIVHDYSGENKKVYNLSEENEGENNGEVVVAIGKRSDLVNTIGVRGIKPMEVYEDIVYNNLIHKLPSIKSFVEFGLSDLVKGKVIPVNKYINEIDRDEVIISEDVIEMSRKEPEDLLTEGIKRAYKNYNRFNFGSLEEIYNAKLAFSTKLKYLVLRATYETTAQELREFLMNNFEKLKSLKPPNLSMVKKLIIILGIKENKSA